MLEEVFGSKGGENEDRERLDIESIFEGVPQGGRDHASWKYACSMRARALSKAEALALMKTAWDRMEQPDQDQYPLEQAIEKVERAWRDYEAGQSAEFEQDSEEKAIQRKQRDIRVYEEARRRHRAEGAEVKFNFPEAGWTLENELADPIPEIQYRVEGWHVIGANVLLIAGYKLGKTTLGDECDALARRWHPVPREVRRRASRWADR